MVTKMNQKSDVQKSDDTGEDHSDQDSGENEAKDKEANVDWESLYKVECMERGRVEDDLAATDVALKIEEERNDQLRARIGDQKFKVGKQRLGMLVCWLIWLIGCWVHALMGYYC